MQQQTVLITGTSSGIGLELVKQFAQDPCISHVFATARKLDPTELKELANQYKGKVFVVRMEPQFLYSAKAAALEVESILGKKGLDILINNIGAVNFLKSVLDISERHLNELYTSNILTTHHTTIAFMNLLSKGNSKKVINISSMVGSITETDGRYPFPVPAYAVSKAGLNMLTRWYANEFSSKGFTFVAVDPGYVANEKQALALGAIPVAESAKGIIKVVSYASNGTFFSYDGSERQW